MKVFLSVCVIWCTWQMKNNRHQQKMYFFVALHPPPSSSQKRSKVREAARKMKWATKRISKPATTEKSPTIPSSNLGSRLLIFSGEKRDTLERKFLIMYSLFVLSGHMFFSTPHLMWLSTHLLRLVLVYFFFLDITLIRIASKVIFSQVFYPFAHLASHILTSTLKSFHLSAHLETSFKMLASHKKDILSESK